MDIANKKISIIGAVRSGVAAAKLAKRLGAFPFVSDQSDYEKISDYLFQLEEQKIPYEYGNHTDKIFDCDFIITSPGVPSDSKILLEARKRKILIISEIEFASWYCKGKIIAITGTNGKTTTTTLMAHVLNSCGVKTYLAGNIGFAFSEIADKVLETEFVALEVSSFQLDFINEFKPNYAMLLNITPDHLDRYLNEYSFYKAAKYRIAENQTEDDFFIVNKDSKDIELIKINTKPRWFYFSLQDEELNGSYLCDGKIKFHRNTTSTIVDVKDLILKGEHNYQNVMAVVIAAKLIGIEDERIKIALMNFKGVEHRLESVRTLDGVEYINDSKATNVDSVWFALRSFNQPIHLILGGKDKGNDYSQIKDEVKQRVKRIYAIGSSKEKVKDFFEEVTETEMFDSLESAVKSAQRKALEGEIVLLSPACASFDMFNNYEHRGEVFKKIVSSL